MRGQIAIAAVVLAAAACGGAARPAGDHADDAPDCAAVAAHVLELAEADNGGSAAPELAAGIRGETEHQCRDTPWSAARRRCLARATSEDATLACPGS